MPQKKSQETLSKPYNVAIDILRILAIAAVVLIHTTTRTLEVSSYDLNRFAWTLFLNQAARFAVPVFFIISGFVLELNYKEQLNYFQFIKKRLNRVIIPYLFWSTIYFFFIFPHQNANIFSWEFLSNILTGSASYQLYFIPTLIIFYALFPLLHRSLEIIKSKWIFIGLGLLEIGLLYIDYFYSFLPLAAPLRVAVLNIFFFIFGSVISRYYSAFMSIINKTKILLFILMIGLMYLVFWEGKYFYFKTNNYQSFYSQWRPSVFFYSLSFFSAMYYLLRKFSKEPYFIKLLSRLSFFVFFIHVAILNFVWQQGFARYINNSGGHIAEQWWFDPLFFLTVIIISTIIAYVVHKIPRFALITG